MSRVRVGHSALDVEERSGQMAGQAADPELGQRARSLPAFGQHRLVQQPGRNLGGVEKRGDHAGMIVIRTGRSLGS